MNKVMLCGRLGGDPELRYTSTGKAVCNLSIATNMQWTDAGGNPQKKTEWHKVVCWGKTAENCVKYLSKGRETIVEGRLETREWEDKEGAKRYSTEVIAEKVEFVGSAPKKENKETTDKGDEAPKSV